MGESLIRFINTRKTMFIVVITTLFAGILSGCGGNNGGDTMSKGTIDDMMGRFHVEQFEVKSDDLNGGVWDTIITNTENGENLSPALSWDPVDGADSYVIYMVDTSANNWMHWKSNGVTYTDLKQGWASDEEYVGPYPPSGTHNYEIYVIALKKDLDHLGGDFDSANNDFEEDLKMLDTPGGNILAYGHIVGTYTHGD